MVTVPHAVKTIVERSRYLSEAMSKGLINYSSLARYMQPEVEEMLVKKVSEASLVMALKRLEVQLKPHIKYTHVFNHTPEMIVRSNLIEFTLLNSETFIKKIPEILQYFHPYQKYFFTLTEGITETTIIVSDDLRPKIMQILEGEQMIATYSKLSSITIRLPYEAIPTPGIFYFFLKSLAWEAINVLEVVSTHLEFTILLEDKEVNRAFAIMKSLFIH